MLLDGLEVLQQYCCRSQAQVKNEVCGWIDNQAHKKPNVNKIKILLQEIIPECKSIFRKRKVPLDMERDAINNTKISRENTRQKKQEIKKQQKKRTVLISTWKIKRSLTQKNRSNG